MKGNQGMCGSAAVSELLVKPWQERATQRAHGVERGRGAPCGLPWCAGLPKSLPIPTQAQGFQSSRGDVGDGNDWHRLVGTWVISALSLCFSDALHLLLFILCCPPPHVSTGDLPSYIPTPFSAGSKTRSEASGNVVIEKQQQPKKNPCWKLFLNKWPLHPPSSLLLQPKHRDTPASWESERNRD